jgi:hypothetical protein
MIDKYEIKARMTPGLLLCLPVLITAGAIGIDHFGWLTSLFGGASMTAVLSLGLSMLLRPGGVAIQKIYYEKWGGPPSTRFLRWSDSKFSDQKKAIIHEKIKQDFNIHLFTVDEERAKPKEADQIISDAFDSIREKLRTTKNKGKLWETHNIDYGFYRNFLGSWSWGLTLALICIIILLMIYFLGGKEDVNLLLGSGLNILYMIVISIYSLRHGEANLKHAAEQYVISAVEAYLSVK